MEGAFAGSASELEGQLRTLIQANIASGAPSGISDEAAQLIEDALDEMEGAVANEKAINQRLWDDDTVQKFADCNSGMTTAFTRAGGVNAKKDTTSTSRSNHNACRTGSGTGEDALRGVEYTKCTAQDQHAEEAATAATDRCDAECTAYSSAAETKECLKRKSDWVMRFKADMDSKFEECETATTAANNKHDECDGEQTAFETAFCNYEVSLTAACDALDTCWDTEVAEEPTRRSDLEDKITSEKVMFKSSHRIRCYLNLLKTANDGETRLTEADYAACDVDEAVTHLDISWTAIPEKSACDRSPVSVKPGDDDFPSEYSGITKSGLAWYRSDYGWVKTPTACPSE